MHTTIAVALAVEVLIVLLDIFVSRGDLVSSPEFVRSSTLHGKIAPLPGFPHSYFFQTHYVCG